VVPLAGFTPAEELDAFAACFVWPGELCVEGELLADDAFFS
jgi:hypothetical protein